MDKAFTTPQKPGHSRNKGFQPLKISLIILTLCLFIGGVAYSVLAKPYNCIPCKENNYCIKGIRYECPLDKPVTQSNRQTSEADCMTCNERNGDETNPVYDITRDECVSCYEYNSDTPIWNGTACVACDTNTPKWENGICTACPDTAPLWTGIKCVTPQFEITSGNTEIKIIEQPATQAFETVAPTTAEAEDEAFLETYGINNASAVYPDYWGGAMKYCQDQGLKIPTIEEFIVILEEALEREINCDISDDFTVCSFGILETELPTNNTLFNFLNIGNGSSYMLAAEIGPTSFYKMKVEREPAKVDSEQTQLTFTINGAGYRNSSYSVLCIETE